MVESTQAHWDQIYVSNPVEALGWYEAVPEPSLRLVEACRLDARDLVLDVGAGASTLAGHLLARGFRDVVAVDLSPVALEQLQTHLDTQVSGRLRCVACDVTRPQALAGLEGAALWHDRALLHFLVDEAPRAGYRATLERVLRPGGYAILATFAPHGAPRCSGLALRRYSLDDLAAFLGPDFGRVAGLEYVYHMPSGDPRPFVYGCFQRKW